MLSFIVPLQSKEASKSWRRVSKLANRTLTSIANQEENDFQILLVCNDVPLGCPDIKNLSIIKEDFLIPQARNERMRDKWIKVRRGLVEVRNSFTDFVMVVDADDYISKKIASYVKQHRSKTESGFLLNQGYLYNSKNSSLYRQGDFHKWCGSSSIIKIKEDDLPDSMEGNHPHCILNYGHSSIDNYFEKIGKPLLPVDFRAAAYTTSTGENDSKFDMNNNITFKKIVSSLRSKVFFDKSIKQELGIL